MLSKYTSYLLNIRNNLIQCGVEVPVVPVQNYEDVFKLEQELDDILWFYRILSISGSEYALKDFFLPLNGYFKERMRHIYYQEFLEFLEDYKTLGVEEVRSKYISNGGGAIYNKDNSEEELITLEEPQEDFQDEDNFHDEEEENEDYSLQEHEEDLSLENNYNNEEDTDEDDLGEDNPFGDRSYVSHGIYIEDLLDDEDEDIDEEDEDQDGLGNYYSEDEEYNDSDDLDTYEEDEDYDDQDGLGYYNQEDEEEYNDQDGLGGYYSEEESEDEYDDQDGLGGYDYEEDEEYDDQDGLGDYGSDEEYDDQDGLGGYNSDEDYDDQDGLGGYYDEDEEYVEEDEEEYDDQDGLGGYYSEDEDEYTEDEDEYDDQDGLGGYYEDEEEEYEEPQPSNTQRQPPKKPVEQSQEPERDLSDVLQDFINGSLTSARNSLRHLKNYKK